MISEDELILQSKTPVLSDETTSLLIRARGFIERGWCRRAEARDSTGRIVDPTSEQAVAWCVLGALHAAGISGSDYWNHPAIHRVVEAINGCWVSGWTICAFNNAQETVEPILAAFDRAIAEVT
jgi:hypothetical protein